MCWTLRFCLRRKAGPMVPSRVSFSWEPLPGVCGGGGTSVIFLSTHPEPFPPELALEPTSHQHTHSPAGGRRGYEVLGVSTETLRLYHVRTRSNLRERRRSSGEDTRP